MLFLNIFFTLFFQFSKLSQDIGQPHVPSCICLNLQIELYFKWTLNGNSVVKVLTILESTYN